MQKGLATPYRSPKRAVAIVLLVFLVLTCIALVVSAQSLRGRIDAVRAADSDNMGWLISQLDVDYKAILLAAKGYVIATRDPSLNEITSADDFDDVRFKFDIFYSRVDTVLAAMTRYDLPAELAKALDQLREARASLTTTIDAITTPDRDKVLAFTTELQQSAELIRDVTVFSLQYQVGQTKAARTLEKAHLQRFWLQSIFLLVVMISASLLAARLWRELERHTAWMHRASGTISKVIQATLNAVIVTDLDGRILLANAAASDIFRVPAEAMLGENIGDLMVPDHMRAKHEAGMHRFRTTGKKKIVGAGPVRLDARRPDGSDFQAELSIATDTDLDGNPILIGFIRDISDIVAAENKLREARDEAERHADAKTMFLATMSHEMRTPLHGVTASLDLIDADRLTEEDRQLLRTAQDCSDRALEQINNVLDITRLGERRDDGETFRPAVIAREIASELSPLAKENGNLLDLQITGVGVEECYIGSPGAFSRALYNLVGNALKFTREGRVDLHLTFDDGHSGDGKLTVEVIDNGPGIAPEDHERIFREFETGRPGELFGPQGTGLGLPIVRIAVQHLGGTLGLESAPGKGSRFSFKIPLRPAPKEQHTDQTRPAEPLFSDDVTSTQTALDVLVVDDSEVNLGLMCEIVRRLGHRPAMARNGQEAIDVANQTAFDVILMDVSMPVMRGDEATRRIRKAGLSRRAFIAAVTAVSDPERTLDLHEAGMDAVLTKPTKRADIANLLAVATATKQPSDHHQPVMSASHYAGVLDALEPMFGEAKARELMTAALADIPPEIIQSDPLHQVTEALVDALHKAAGSTAVVGLNELSSHLLEAERAADRGDLEALNRQREKIGKALSDCQDALGLGNVA
ncbi:multisensor hybrid histidine kinase [Roseobacter sp. AzwK-3b]|uniref:ATP-binding protein n=1 Tax=Roseobacter sp. AzwK-3b TaxID=351016 RepID=UPI0001568BBC|nr:ATP-binding protein [Roseobacter sp. AzwK-3b]EDM72841.1 multisensor hybrid histidine kinase [Roseobacter sp. AzwK-3b]